MKLKNLIEYDFVNDKTALRIRHVGTKEFKNIKNERWYNDQILNFMDFGVRKFVYYSDLNLLEVSLEFPEDEENKQEIKTPKQGLEKEI